MVQAINLKNKVVFLVLYWVRKECKNLMDDCFVGRIVDIDFIQFIYIFVEFHVFGNNICFYLAY